MAEPQRGDRQ